MTAADLIAWRDYAGLTQAQLAAVLDVSNMTVWKWENGRHAIPRAVELALWAIDRGALENLKKAHFEVVHQ